MLSFFTGILKKNKSRNLLTKERIKEIERLIGKKIRNYNVYLEALSHRSVIDKEKFKVSNERLEFLGDAVLGFVVGEYLFEKFPTINEGTLTKMRANLVNKNALFAVAKKINLFDLLFVNDDLLTCENFGYKTILADAFEALTGAIYIDAGFETASEFTIKYVLKPNLKSGKHLADNNYKSQLLEFVQSMKIQIPRYSVISEDGPEHDRMFTIRVSIGNQVLGDGKGKNKKAAEQEAAKKALERISAVEHLLDNHHNNGNNNH